MGKQAQRKKVRPGPDHKRTRFAVRQAVREVRGAAHPRIHSVRDGISWVIAMGAGAAVAWKSWQSAREPLPEGHDNKSAKQFTAQLERERRLALPPGPENHSGNGNTEKPTEDKIGDKTKAKKNLTIEMRQQTSLSEIDRTLRKVRANGGDYHSAQQNGAELSVRNDLAAPSPTDADEQPKIEQGALALGKEFYKRFSEDEITTRASALAFVGVFSLVPLLLFALIGLGFLFQDPIEASKHIQAAIQQLLPGESAQKAASEVLQQTHLVETAQTMARGAILPLIIGVASLFWAGLSLLVTATTPMNAAWDVTETRSFLTLRLMCVKVFFGAGALFALSLVISSGAHGVLAALGVPDNLPPILATLLDFGFIVLATSVNVLMFIMIYRYLPNAKVLWKAAGFAGVITGVLWEAFKQGFAFYLAHFGNSNNKMYGALGGIVLLITWIYYSCVVLLAGAELAKMYHEHREEGGVTERAPRETEPAAMQKMPGRAA